MLDQRDVCVILDRLSERPSADPGHEEALQKVAELLGTLLDEGAPVGPEALSARLAEVLEGVPSVAAIPALPPMAEGARRHMYFKGVPAASVVKAYREPDQTWAADGDLSGQVRVSGSVALTVDEAGTVVLIAPASLALARRRGANTRSSTGQPRS